MSAFVYELVDATDDEMYFGIGLFSSEAVAEAFVDERMDDPRFMTDCDHDQYMKVELRRRPLDEWSSVGKTVRTWEWTQEYDERADEYKWATLEKTNGPSQN